MNNGQIQPYAGYRDSSYRCCACGATVTVAEVALRDVTSPEGYLTRVWAIPEAVLCGCGGAQSMQLIAAA